MADWRTVRIVGFSLKNQPRPLKVSVEIDRYVSDEKQLRLSWVQRYVPRVIAVAVLGILLTLVYFLSRQNRSSDRKYSTLSYLFIEPQSNTYSLSKFQMIVWGFAFIVAYAYLAASQFFVQWNWVVPNVPDGLPMLLGISAGTTAVSIGVTDFKGSKGAGSVHPRFGDLITVGNVLASERLQFFLWTVLGSVAFVCSTLSQDPGTADKMAEIPNTFNQLMGASSLGYLSGKFARNPGPVIRQLAPQPPYQSFENIKDGILIIGENLSPQAEVTLNGKVLPRERIEQSLRQPHDKEFVSELILKPTEEDMKPADGKTASLKIRNPDGQSAEM